MFKLILDLTGPGTGEVKISYICLHSKFVR